MERFAVSRLHLKDGRVLKNYVIEVSDDGKVFFAPLQEELPFTEWRGGDYFEKD